MIPFCAYVFKCIFLMVLSFLIGLPSSNAQQKIEKYQPQPHKIDAEQFSFDAYTTNDKFDRIIHFYLSKPANKTAQQQQPLVVCIQGSGCQSLFIELDTPKGKVVASMGPEAAVLRTMRDKVRVMVVEKPGVPFKFQPNRPGSSTEGSKEFLTEFSLPRWVEAINASLNAASKLDVIDTSKVLALGHSEGGQVACELAVANPLVTHVAVMAGGGPSQLFDFINFARTGDMFDPNDSAENRVKALLDDWKKVLAAPTATDKFILGHTHLRWSTFTATSPLEALLKTKLPVFIAQGTADTNSLPASADVLYAELLARGREVTYERIKGGDHAFMTSNDKNGDGWLKTNTKAVKWFLEKQL